MSNYYHIITCIDVYTISFKIISARRGCQLSLVAHGFGRELFQALTDAGVVVDWREPNVIRMAPVPMYNTFEDIARFVHILKSATQPH